MPIQLAYYFPPEQQSLEVSAAMAWSGAVLSFLIDNHNMVGQHILKVEMSELNP